MEGRGLVSTLSIHLFGGLRIELTDGPRELGSQRVRALIAHLLLHRDGPHHRARLAYLLWPDSDEAQARTNLRKALHQLRRSLPEVKRLLAMDGSTLTWRPEAHFELDVERFERAIQSAQQAEASGALELERGHLEAAARLYRGDLLPEMYDDWLEAERERLRQRCAHVLERLVDVLWKQRDDRAAVGYAQRLVRHDPWVESSYRRLMRLYARSGERAKALHVYHSCASVLQEQLQVGPSTETIELYEDVLRLEAAGTSVQARAPHETERHDAVASAPLVGRRGELGALRAAWDETDGSRTAFVLVSGDPGIGKTRLVADFARSLPRREATVITARCHAPERSLAFAPVVALLRSTVIRETLQDLEPVWRREASRLVPDLVDGPSHDPGPLTEGWQRRRLFEALTHAMLASQPLVAVIDDVQWSDSDSLDWLQYLLRFDTDARCMLVATSRTHELDANPRLRTLLTDLERDGLLARIDLGPLTAEETATLARSLHHGEPAPEALRAIVEETEGNPLFVVEMVREGDRLSTTPATEHGEQPTTTLPRRLRAVIASRLERLSASSSAVMGMAAVIGREFDFDLLVRVSRQDEDVAVQSLDELWRRRIVRELGAGQYDFSHNKLREVAYGALSLTHRRLLHRYTAEALETLDGDEREGVSGRIAFHYDRAGDDERAITYYRRAAEAARSLYAHEEALSAYTRGLELIEDLSPTSAMENWRGLMKAELHEGIGDIFGLRAQHADARAHFEQALEHRSDDGIGSARLWRKVGLTHTAQYRYDEAAMAYASAEAALGPAEADAGTPWWREWIDIHLARSSMFYWQLAWHDCERVLAPMERAVMQHGTALQRCSYFRGMADKDFAQRRCVVSAERMAYSRAALAAAEESGSATTIADARFSSGFAYLWYGDLQRAAEHLEAALAASEETGNSVLRARCLTYLCFLHRKRGDAATTERYAHESLDAARELTMPEYIGAAHGHLAWLAWRHRDHDTCRREGGTALTSWATGQRYPLQWCARVPLLAASLTQQRVDDALENAAALLDPYQQRLPDELTELLDRAVRAGSDIGTAAAALERSVRLATRARLL
jgi:DNA-binding SARP family transcriptional activator